MHNIFEVPARKGLTDLAEGLQRLRWSDLNNASVLNEWRR